MIVTEDNQSTRRKTSPSFNFSAINVPRTVLGWKLDWYILREYRSKCWKYTLQQMLTFHSAFYPFCQFTWSSRHMTLSEQCKDFYNVIKPGS